MDYCPDSDLALFDMEYVGDDESDDYIQEDESSSYSDGEEEGEIEYDDEDVDTEEPFTPRVNLDITKENNIGGVFINRNVIKSIRAKEEAETIEDEEEGEMEEEEEEGEEEGEHLKSEIERDYSSYSNVDISIETTEDMLKSLLISTNPRTHAIHMKRDSEGLLVPDEVTPANPNYGNCLYEPFPREILKFRPNNSNDLFGNKYKFEDWVNPFWDGISKPRNKGTIFNKSEYITPMKQIMREHEDEVKEIRKSVAKYVSSVQDEEDAKNLKSRRHVYSEILSNEQDYVINLKLFLKVYVIPMKEYVRNDLWKSMKNSVETIIGINEPFLKKMLECYERGKRKNKEEPIGLENLFFSEGTSQTFKLYFSYVLYYTDWLKEIKELIEKNEKFRNWSNGVHEKLKMSGKRKTAITTFLPQPYQHICRYKLLLAELLKRTPTSMNTHDAVKTALKTMSKITKFVNQKKKEVRQRQKIKEVFEKIHSLRDLVGKEVLFDSDGTLAGSKTQVTLWLFAGEVVLVAKKKPTRIKLSDPTTRVTQDKEDTFNLVITHKKKEIKFRADSPSKCAELLEKIRHQIGKLGGHSISLRELRCGYLQREEGTIFSKFKKRWCIVHSDRSFLVLKEKGGKILTKEPILGGKYSIKDKKKITFCIKTKKTTMVFKCENENEMNTWFIALRMVHCKQE